MANFKHITVTPADEDDEVIIAGAGQPQAIAHAPEPDGDPRPEPEAPRASQPDPRAASRPEAARKANARSTTQDAYHETTLEDLEARGMPFAQKVVIIAAVVCIIGALVYYFAVMR